MNKVIQFFLLVVLVTIGGCAAMPARQSLGLDRAGGDKGIERLISALILVNIPHRSEARGFEFELPKVLVRDGLVGISKEFTDFGGNSVQLTRKAFQGTDYEGNIISIYISNGKAYAFSKWEVLKLKVFSPDGKSFDISPVRALSEEEIDRLYTSIALEFPKTSLPIEGSDIRFHYGPEAKISLTVPQTVTFWERGAITGLGSIVVTPNPYALAISKFIAFFRTQTMIPTEGTLAEAPVVAEVTETNLFLGGDR